MEKKEAIYYDRYTGKPRQKEKTKQLTFEDFEEVMKRSFGVRLKEVLQDTIHYGIDPRVFFLRYPESEEDDMEYVTVKLKDVERLYDKIRLEASYGGQK